VTESIERQFVDGSWVYTVGPAPSGGSGTFTTPVEIETSDVDSVALTVVVPNGMNESAVEVSTATGPSVSMYADDTAAFFSLGGGSAGQVQVQVSTSGDSGVSVIDSSGQRSVQLVTTEDQNLATFTVGGVSKLAVDANGYLHIHQTTAPADEDIAPNELVIWFDGNDLSPRVHFTGKTDDGDIVSATLDLAP